MELINLNTPELALTKRLLLNGGLAVHPAVDSVYLCGSRGPKANWREDSDIDLSLRLPPGPAPTAKLCREILDYTQSHWHGGVELDLDVIFDRRGCGLHCMAAQRAGTGFCDGGVDCFGIYKTQRGFDGFIENFGVCVERSFPSLPIWTAEIPFVIRREEPADYAGIDQLVKCVFATSPHADGTEPDYLNALREKTTFIPELALVAEHESGRLIGQIVLYETPVHTTSGDVTQLLLSPICVHPGYFRRGIARAMMRAAFGRARRMGYKLVFLCGDPAFYGKFGFIPTYLAQIYHRNDPEHHATWSMVKELEPGALKEVNGWIETV